MNNDLPAGASRVTPYLTVHDAEASAAFYSRAFGFTETERIPGRDGRPLHIGMAYGGQSVVMFAPENTWSDIQSPARSGTAMPVSFYVYCPDVDALLERARAAEARVLAEPEDMFWGDRILCLADPDGYEWTFATKVGALDPGRIPRV